jgi:hypothetical protein
MPKRNQDVEKEMNKNEERANAELNEVSTEGESSEASTRESIEQIQTDIQGLQKQFQGQSLKSTIRLTAVFVIPGVLSLVLSIVSGSPVLAFIGLGLTFWGTIFYLVRPTAYVQGSLLNTTVTPLYQIIDRITRDLDIKGKAIYIPPYPKEVYLPQHLKGLKETIVFLPKDTDQTLPSIEEMATSKFMTKKPKGVILIPPGSGYLDRIEKLMRTDMTKTTLEDLCTTLPQIVLENFQLAKEIEMKTENNQIHLKTIDSIYKNLYLEEDLKAVRLIGDPLTSAIACAIAKATGKQLTIEAINITPDMRTLEATYQLREG